MMIAFTSLAKGGYVLAELVCLLVSNTTQKHYERIAMKFNGGVRVIQGRLNSGGDLGAS